ncbi:hypothetical protein [Prevotella sp.]|uniref:hypothetical protein n=1 Tax=Prevotella sp. TaxID=59823 RepID=UPI0030801F07
MKKKEYIKPQMNVFKADMQALLAGSQTETIQLERASETDYTDEQVKTLWDREETKTIWAD